MNLPSIVGFWHLVSSRTRSIEGTWIEEKVIGGSLVFTEKGNLCVFGVTSEGPYGYAGKYTLNGSEVSVHIQAGIYEDMHGTVPVRKLTFDGPNKVYYGGVEFHTGRSFELGLVRE